MNQFYEWSVVLFFPLLLVIGCSEQVTDGSEKPSKAKNTEINTEFFLPTTTIEFELPEPSIVTLRIYDGLGKVVATILDHVSMDEGLQGVSFDASNLSSGMYLYEIIVQSIQNPAYVYQATRRLLLIK